MSAIPAGALCYLLDGSVCSARPDPIYAGYYCVFGVTGDRELHGVQRVALRPLDVRIRADRDAAGQFFGVDVFS